MPLPAGTRVGPYEIVSIAGTGGMGEVYVALDTRLGRQVALKFLPDRTDLAPDAIERFEREARIASSLNHPNICTLFDIGVDQAHGGRRFIVMELLDGESLRAKITGQPLPLDQILDVGAQIADALDAAHAKGIVHRDIKPANILVTKRGQAKLLDFGIAKLGGDAHGGAADETHLGADALTAAGTTVGSVNYMSPEQARGEELDGRTDLFSLGLVLYEMATGRQAFGGPTTAVVFDAILNRHPPAPRTTNPALPEDLERVILRALEKDRRVRFQTAADMLAELSRIKRDTGSRTATAIGGTAAAVHAPAVGPAAGAPAAARRPWRWAAIGVPTVLLLAGGGYYAWRATRPPVLTERDTVVVADFVNTTGDPVFDVALKQATAVQLQQTPFITLLPDQKVQRTLRLMQRPTDAPLTGAVVRELCQRAGAKATVEGSIGSLGTSYLITLGVHNCQTGESLAEQQGQARTKEDVITTLGTAVTDLRRHLGESLASIQKYDVPVTDATTSSLEALRAYGLGNKARVTTGDEAAVPFFQEAIQRDPNFALAYAKLSVVNSNLGNVDEMRANAQKAYDLRDRVSEYERLYIQWNYVSHVQADEKKAKDALELMTASYPRDFAAHNNLGVYYMARGEFDAALKEFTAATGIAPDEPLPLSNSMYTLFFLGRYAEGFEKARQSLAIRPNGNVAIACWTAAAVLGDAREAEYERTARSLATPDQVLSIDASLALWRGQLGTYDRKLEERRAHARAAHDAALLASLDAEQLTAHAYFEGGPAVDALAAAAAKATSPDVLAQEAGALAVIGRMAAVRAILPKLEGAKAGSSASFNRTVARSYLKAADGHAAEAIADLESALVATPRALGLNFYIGDLRERSGDVAGAAENYRVLIRGASATGLDPSTSAARLALGELLLKQGDRAGAKEQFDALLAQWKNAEPGFAPLIRAKADRAKVGE